MLRLTLLPLDAVGAPILVNEIGILILIAAGVSAVVTCIIMIIRKNKRK